MKIKFERDLDFQLEAISSIVDIFEGQEISQSNFTVNAPRYDGNQMIMDFEHIGVGNRLKLLDDEIKKNIQKIQLRNGLKQITELESNDFSVEMETGTGKTYVYLRTIFELQKKYGFNKFIIVVPSIAIKEGVNKTLQITKEHFKMLYENVKYDYFTYDSSKLEQVRSFATNDYIQIMIINIDAFRKSFVNIQKEDKSNIIHRYNDKLGYKPIELIQSTNPIVIIDEPQSVDNTDNSKKAIASLEPLCKLRYSATHKEKYNFMYKLDAVEAYERKLVKQIEVASIEVEAYHNKAYIKLLKVDNSKLVHRAYVEIDINKNGQTKREKRWVYQNDDLHEICKRDVYEGYIIKDIYSKKGEEYIDFTSVDEVVELGKSIGTIHPDTLKREQIKKTIKEHLNKELVLNPKGIKVLSLFFIDKVSNYRVYDEEGNDSNGKFAKMFEEEYQILIKSPKYRTLTEGVYHIDADVSQVHNGYFSIDKKSKASNKKEKFEYFKDTSGKIIADNDTYNLIMRNKEELLSFKSKLRFIFSHSALREGWDNPNVFQICTLNEGTKSTIRKRQEIGRGLRLAVNKHGERVYGFEVNRLTVMVNETYEEFIAALQKEIVEDTGIKFGIVYDHTFANVITGIEADGEQYLGQELSEELFEFFKTKGYINNKGKVQDPLKIDLKQNRIDIPESMNNYKVQIVKKLKSVAGNLNILNAKKGRKVKLNKAVCLSPEFKELWEKIKYKTLYSVDFDSQELIEECVSRIKNELIVPHAKIVYRTTQIGITQGGVDADKNGVHTETTLLKESDYMLPDLVSMIQNETNLTRKSIVEVLVKCQKLDDFKKNPQRFIDEVIKIIKEQMRHFIIKGIKYEKIGEHEVYKQELFKEEELYGYLETNMIESTKSPYDYVIYDSLIESDLAYNFERSDNIKVYAKLPPWFKISTPLGSYNPDWAVLYEQDKVQKLYFIVETKGSLATEFLRPIEQGKVKCGKEHFKALDNGIELEVASSFESLSDIMSQF